MPADRSAPHVETRSNPCECGICGQIISRSKDMSRHMRLHDSSLGFVCEFEGCTYSTHQRHNMTIHSRRHTQEKRYVCTDDEACTFRTCDPSSLLRHRKRKHAYVPRTIAPRMKPISLNPRHAIRKATHEGNTSPGDISRSSRLSFGAQPSSSLSSPVIVLSDFTDSDSGESDLIPWTPDAVCVPESNADYDSTLGDQSMAASSFSPPGLMEKQWPWQFDPSSASPLITPSEPSPYDVLNAATLFAPVHQPAFVPNTFPGYACPGMDEYRIWEPTAVPYYPQYASTNYPVSSLSCFSVPTETVCDPLISSDLSLGQYAIQQQFCEPFDFSPPISVPQLQSPYETHELMQELLSEEKLYIPNQGDEMDFRRYMSSDPDHSLDVLVEKPLCYSEHHIW